MKDSPLFPADAHLFKEMAGNYTSDNEKKFFETMKYKEENEPVGTQDILFLENSNEDGIYFIREGFCEYLIGARYGVHVMPLADALQVNLKDLGCVNKNMTLLDWLRQRDYKGISYDNNLDYKDNG